MGCTKNEVGTQQFPTLACTIFQSNFLRGKSQIPSCSQLFPKLVHPGKCFPIVFVCLCVCIDIYGCLFMLNGCLVVMANEQGLAQAGNWSEKGYVPFLRYHLCGQTDIVGRFSPPVNHYRCGKALVSFPFFKIIFAFSKSKFVCWKVRSSFFRVCPKLRYTFYIPKYGS